MKRLAKADQLYLIILYAIWELLSYYEKLFKLEVPSDATKLPVTITSDENDITHLLVEVPSSRTPDPYYTGECMKLILNEYMNIILLPEHPELKPFQGGDSRFDLVDCLYVYQAHVLGNRNGYTYAHFDIIYVDNMQAFKFVRADNEFKI